MCCCKADCKFRDSDLELIHDGEGSAPRQWTLIQCARSIIRYLETYSQEYISAAREELMCDCVSKYFAFSLVYTLLSEIGEKDIKYEWFA